MYSIILPVMFLLLTACGQDLNFKVHFADIGGLKAGAPVLADSQPVGEVTGIEGDAGKGYLVGVSIDRQHQAVATEDSQFVLADLPNDASQKCIEIVQSRPGGKPIVDGATVEGSYPTPLGNFPFGELFKEIGRAMKDFTGQVERYRKEFEKLPDSEEGKRLQQDWRKLLDELTKAQSSAESTLRKDVVPKLQEELDVLRKKLEELQKEPKKPGKPVET